MSDLSSLSDEYSINAEFAELVTDVVLQLKMMREAEEPSAAESATEGAKAMAAAANIVHSVRAAFAGQAKAEWIQVPEDVLSRLRARHSGKLDWFLQDLVAFEDPAGWKAPPSDEQIAILDEISDAADSAASAVFRRLWRR
jgi:hypothetical protein